MTSDMEKPKRAAGGPVTSKGYKEFLVCQQIHMNNSKGLWLADNPFDYSSPTLMAQLIVIFFVTRLTYFFLKPLGQSMISAQIVAGMIIGPSFLGYFSIMHMQTLFPVGSKLVLQTLGEVGFMLHLFLIGIQMDVSILKKAGKNVYLIGITSFALPYVLGGFTYFLLTRLLTLSKVLLMCLPFIVAVNSMTSFAVIATLLSDLNILNSELGRLAVSTAMISDLCSWLISTIMMPIGVAGRDGSWWPAWSVVSVSIFLIVIYYVLRPLVLWIAKTTPEGENLKQVHFFAILTIILSCGFCTELLGHHAAFGPLMLGMTLPDGPPLGTSLVGKIDTLATGVLLPIFFAISGLKTNLFSLGQVKSALITEFIIIMGYLGKFMGTLVGGIFCHLPFWDAFSLALIMSCKGIIEVATYIIWKDGQILNSQSFSLLLITMLLVTGVARPIIGHLYDPSRRYMTYTRRTIQHSKENVELRILVCIHHEDNVPTMVNLLEASNPTRFNAISILVIQLMELIGSATAVLVPHGQQNKQNFNLAHSEHIVNAFNHYEKQNHGRVSVQHYTAIAPYASMHDDICTLALDNKITIIIVPFHKKWTIDGSIGATLPNIRTVNRNVITRAPCSVGVLVDRGHMGDHPSILSGQSLYCIALFFLGGPDDREALAYAKRMGEHQHVRLTVVWFKPKSEHESKEKGSDRVAIDEFKSSSVGKSRIVYKEETVIDGVGTTRVIRTMEDSFDLVLVGKNHDPDSQPLLGLTEWSECPELGVIGDMLATSDFRFSVLVVQQQPL